MSATAESYELDPLVLDDIVRDLDLQQANALERLQAWYRDVLSTAWNWAKKLTGGDDGWLQNAGDWLVDWLSSVAGSEPLNAERIIDGVTIVTVALLVFGVSYLGYRLWQLYRPLESVQPAAMSYLLTDPELRKPLEQLTPQQKAPALLSQVCVALIAHDKLTLHPHSTNAAIARNAQLSASLRGSLNQLAQAADRSLFGGWVPAAQELASLREHRNEIIGALGQRH